jgi:hypothetical protein
VVTAFFSKAVCCGSRGSSECSEGSPSPAAILDLAPSPPQYHSIQAKAAAGFFALVGIQYPTAPYVGLIRVEPSSGAALNWSLVS